MHDVFISYSSKDQTVTDAIVNMLEGRRSWGIGAWDYRVSGRNYGEPDLRSAGVGFRLVFSRIISVPEVL
jgi:formylglycine-generating enzyme required for sulfatase activity